MKKVMSMVLALFFVAATSNLVLAQTTPASPKVKSTKHGHKKHHSKKKGETPAGAPAK